MNGFVTPQHRAARTMRITPPAIWAFWACFQKESRGRRTATICPTVNRTTAVLDATQGHIARSHPPASPDAVRQWCASIHETNGNKHVCAAGCATRERWQRHGEQSRAVLARRCAPDASAAVFPSLRPQAGPDAIGCQASMPRSRQVQPSGQAALDGHKGGQGRGEPDLVIAQAGASNGKPAGEAGPEQGGTAPKGPPSGTPGTASAAQSGQAGASAARGSGVFRDSELYRSRGLGSVHDLRPALADRAPTVGSLTEPIATQAPGASHTETSGEEEVRTLTDTVDMATKVGSTPRDGPTSSTSLKADQPPTARTAVAGTGSALDKGVVSPYTETPHSPFAIDGVAVANAPALPPPVLSEANDPNPVWRPTDEDAHVHGQLRVGGAAPRDYYFFAVFDGHGGGAASKFVSGRIWNHLASRLAASEPLEQSITEAFFDADEELRTGCDHQNAGSTGAVALLTSGQQASEWALTVANCGDTRVVLSARNRVVRLSTDHSPAVPSERERIERSGGWVASDRVIGVLAVSRAFGNFEMKELCPPTPTISQVLLRGKPRQRWARFLIIACDGLWDVMSDSEAVSFVKRNAEAAHASGSEDPLGVAARTLVEEALDRGTTDNVTVQVIFF